MHTTTHLAGEAMRSGTASVRAAHAALFERVVTRIHRYFQRMVRDPHEADECLQRTLTLLEESLARSAYDPGRSFNTWMWLKARTVHAQWCRERSRRPGSLAPGQAVEPGSVVAGVDRRLDGEAVLAAVRERLGDEVYEAFVLYYEGGLTQAEVGEALGRDRKTVRQRIAQAHDLIDRLLGEAAG